MRFQILSLLIILTFINCQNTFTFGSKDAGSCANDVYTFTVTGTVGTATESVTEWTPTLTAPTGATVTCTMPAVNSNGGSGIITCSITSDFTNSAITLTGLAASGFTSVELTGGNDAIATGKTCPLNTFRYASKTEGSCDDNEYSFTITGTVATATDSETTWTATLTAPTGATASCTMPAATTAANNAVITCTISNALSNSAITLTKLEADGFYDVNLSGDSSTIATGKTCPLNTFTYGNKTEGSCADNVYTFTVTGTVTAQTTAATTWTPTFSAPTNPTATCTMPVVAADGGSGTITCKITSALSNSDITLTQLVSDSFNDVTIALGEQAIATGKTCAGTTTTNPTTTTPSNDGSKFISLNAILFSFFLLIF